MNVVISQPMYFPWVGLLEQVRLADKFVFYSDVQFARGFFNRVQVKTDPDTSWMTVPVKNVRSRQRIDEVEIDHKKNWKQEHLAILKRSLGKAPFFSDVEGLCDSVWSEPCTTLDQLSSLSIVALSRYFGLTETTEFLDSRDIGVDGAGSQRLLDICNALKASCYITGHGAANYLQHELFEEKAVEVKYMDYKCAPYTQFFGTFTPYVTSLDLIAHQGKAGLHYLQSGVVDWRSHCLTRGK
ncbi:WbqC-like protein [Rheinheimera sp. A13L]|uniref:WbqC family protein n=1 Tax=Rheinheimera sp. A13L TaxID=506534 RepID=UPI00021255DE|nr:WbqC family protein [Rheinheimera sp. A13L]EGM78232.1 WbqC-like protein [Rheinheimera sp. A13L]